MLQRWARVYRQTSFHAAVETNNGIEDQNRVLKYSYLPQRRNITLSCLVEILITSFLPDSYEKYLFQNYKMSYAYRSYSDDVPKYLHGRPPALIKHCLNRLEKAKRKFTNESFLNCDVEKGKFSLAGESSTHHIDFGLSNGQPSCTCGDWSKTHYPCKHFFAVFLYQSGWRWESLPEAYLNSPYMCSDTHALTEATMENEGIMPDVVPMLENQTDLDVFPPQDFCEEIEIPPKEENSAELVPYMNGSVEGIPNDKMAGSSNTAAPLTTDVKPQELEVSDLKKRVCK